MPRRKYLEPRVFWRIGVPKNLAAEIELMLLDPFLMQAKFGAKTELVVQLLTEWRDKQITNKQPLAIKPIPLEEQKP